MSGDHRIGHTHRHPSEFGKHQWSPRHEGHKRLYLAEEAIEIAVIAELRRKGFSLQKIRRVLRFLQKEMGKRLPEILSSPYDMHLVTDGKSIYLESENDSIIDILKSADQPMFLVCITDQVKRLGTTVPVETPARKSAGRETPRTIRRARAV
jgi:DNA-binding transcriptional MerR regulator